MMALAVVTSFASSADSPAAKLRPQTEQTSDCYDFPQKNFHRDNCVKATYGASPAIPMGEGEAAIDFTLHDLAGTPHTLSHMLESKPVLLVWGMWTCPAYQVAPRFLNHASSQPDGTADPSALCATARAGPVNYPAPPGLLVGTGRLLHGPPPHHQSSGHVWGRLPRASNLRGATPTIGVTSGARLARTSLIFPSLGIHSREECGSCFEPLRRA
jgi:hypothetical protein